MRLLSFTTRSENKTHGWWLAFGLLITTFVLYYAGAGGPFVLDDFSSIVLNKQLQIKEITLSSLLDAAFSSNAGLLRRPVAMLSFALNYYFNGLDPFFYKIVNIVIHLTTALLLFFLTDRLLGRLSASVPENNIQRRYGAALITVLWALHPLHVSTVLYTVQRMTELTALFTVAGVLLYVRGRELMLDGKTGGGLARILMGLAGFGTLALLSKENGALLPVYLLVVEAVFFRFVTQAQKTSAIGVFTVLGLSTFALLGYLTYIWVSPPNLGREFTQTERLLTEFRILFSYLGQILLPRVNQMSLFDSGVEISRGFLSPPSTIAAILAFFILAGGAAFGVWKNLWRPFVFACGWFLAGHLLESTVIPLELRFEHRNYLASYGILFAVGHGLLHSRIAAHLRSGLHAALIAILTIGLADQLHTRVTQWSTPGNFYRFELTHNPASPRPWSSLAYSEDWQGRYESAAQLYGKAAELEPREVGHLIAMLNLSIHALNNAPSPVIAGQIIERLERFPLSAYGESQLLLFSAATVKKAGNSPVLKDLITRILTAAAANHRWTAGRNRAVCFYFMADLAIDGGQVEPAIRALREGIAIAPLDGKRLILVELLYYSGQIEEARAEFDLIDINNLESALREYYRKVGERIKGKGRKGDSASPSPATSGNDV